MDNDRPPRVYHLHEIMSPHSTKGLNKRAKKGDAPRPVKIGTRVKASDLKAVQAEEAKCENTFSLLAEKRIRELSQEGYSMRIMATGNLESNPQEVTPEIFLKGITIDSMKETPNGRFWGISRRLVDGKQVVDLWVLVPQEARK